MLLTENSRVTFRKCSLLIAETVSPTFREIFKVRVQIGTFSRETITASGVSSADQINIRRHSRPVDPHLSQIQIVSDDPSSSFSNLPQSGQPVNRYTLFPALIFNITFQRQPCIIYANMLPNLWLTNDPVPWILSCTRCCLTWPRAAVVAGAQL